MDQQSGSMSLRVRGDCLYPAASHEWGRTGCGGLPRTVMILFKTVHRSRHLFCYPSFSCRAWVGSWLCMVHGHISRVVDKTKTTIKPLSKPACLVASAQPRPKFSTARVLRRRSPRLDDHHHHQNRPANPKETAVGCRPSRPSVARVAWYGPRRVNIGMQRETT
jgi:hypothetical protein